MNTIGPIIIVIEVFWIVILWLRYRFLRSSYDKMVGFLAAIINNKNIIEESIATIALAYGMSVEDLVKMLEGKKNEH